MNDHFTSADTKKTGSHLIRAQQPTLHHELIYEILFPAINSTNKIESSLVKLLRELIEDEVVCVEQFVKVNKQFSMVLVIY